MDYVKQRVSHWPEQNLMVWEKKMDMSVPGVKGKQLGVHKKEGVHNFMASALWAAIDVLHHLALQELNALFAQLWMDQSLHSLQRTGQKNRRYSTSSSPASSTGMSGPSAQARQRSSSWGKATFQLCTSLSPPAI